MQYTIALLYMDAVTFHRIQGASLNQIIKMMIHTNLWEATQSYVGISRTTNKNKLHILFWDDDFFDETIKTLYEEESVQTCLRANETILKDDQKFREMFAKVKSTGHKWWDANTCNKLTCSICKRRFEYELKVLESLQLDDIIIFEIKIR